MSELLKTLLGSEFENFPETSSPTSPSSPKPPCVGDEGEDGDGIPEKFLESAPPAPLELGKTGEDDRRGSSPIRNNVTPNRRHPLIAPEVRAKIEVIEADARAKGWPAELLWNAGFWDRPRGLAAMLDGDDEIIEVTPEHIAILKTKRDVLRFSRCNS